jgi:hypothetical protein
MDLSQAVHDGGDALLPISDSCLSHLQTILHTELQALTSTSPQLNLARSLHHKQHKQQQQPEAIPLLGSFLLQLVAKDEDHPGSHPELVQSLLQCSTFARALHSELQSLRSAASSSYSSMKQTLASVGQYLPPAADSANNSPTDAAGNSSHYYGQGLNLGQLQQQADESSLALINLEDAVTSSAASLANLAQQYDITLTAALARAERLADPISPTAAARENGEVQYGFFTPGVCSHSAKKQMYKFTAGWCGFGPRESRDYVCAGGGGVGVDVDPAHARQGAQCMCAEAVLCQAAAVTPAAARENGEVQYGFFTPGVCSHSAKKHMYKFTAGVCVGVEAAPAATIVLPSLQVLLLTRTSSQIKVNLLLCNHWLQSPHACRLFCAPVAVPFTPSSPAGVAADANNSSPAATVMSQPPNA